MEKKSCICTHEVTKEVEYFILREDAAIVKEQYVIYKENEQFDTKYYFCHPNAIEGIQYNYKTPSIIKDYGKNICVTVPEFLELYKKAPYGSDKFDALDKIIYNIKDLFELCAKDKIDTDNLVFAWYNVMEGVYYKFENGNHDKDFVHPIKYDDCCYEINNSRYDLGKLAEALKPDIENGKIMIYPNNSSIIKDIPHFNRFDDRGTEFIRFFIITDAEHFKEEKNYYDDLILKYEYNRNKEEDDT